MGKRLKEEGIRLAVCLRILITLVGVMSVTRGIGWCMTADELRVGPSTEDKRYNSYNRLATTYANRKDHGEIFAKWKNYIGVWDSRDRSGQYMFSVVVIPRLPRPGVDAPDGTLAGFIPAGEYEGILFFESPDHNTQFQEAIVITGELIKADADLTRLEAKLLIPFPHHKTRSVPNKRYLILQLKHTHIRKEYLLEWINDIDDEALSLVSIIGHRGLGFAGLDNTPTALRHAWYFGASGIEFDITVPYEYYYFGDGQYVRLPLTSKLVVFHPPFVYKTRAVHQIPKGFLAAEKVFHEMDNLWVQFIYVDPKVKWLSGEIRREVLNTITVLANETLNRNNRLKITIAAPDDDTATFLSNPESYISSSHREPSRLSWTLEWTEVSQVRHLFVDGKKAPFALSFNLMGIRDGSKWPLIEWIFEDIPQNEEKEIAQKNQPLIFWTANTDEQFTAAVNAAKQPNRMKRSGEPGEIGIMTDYPHRLAFWLATSEKNILIRKESIMTQEEAVDPIHLISKANEVGTN